MFENIPKNWKKDKLKNYIDIIRGVNYKTDEAYDIVTPDTTVLLRANNISSNGTINFDKVIYVSNRNIKKEQIIKKNDILIAMSSGSKDLVGKAAQSNSDLDCSFGAFCGVIRPKIINPKLIGYYFQTDFYRTKISELSTGININNLRKEYIENLDIAIPLTSEEQQEIVNVLDAASEIIRLRTVCIESAQSLIPALFQEIFGDMSKNTNTYELFKIKDLGKVTTGSTPSSKKENMFEGDIPFITPADLESGQDKYGRYVTSEGAQNSRIVRGGSTLVCCIGATIGKVDRAIVDSCFNQQINAIEWNENINDIFGLYLFRQIASLIRNKASHTTLPILNKGNFENIIIPKPPIEQQELFATKVQEIEAYIKAQQAELENAKTMFQSLLHHSFTGKLTKYLQKSNKRK